MRQTKLLCYGYGYRPHVYDENDDRKRNISKTLSRVDFPGAYAAFSAAGGGGGAL